MSKLHALTAKETVEKIRNKEATAEECISSAFERIRMVEDKVHAFVTLIEEKALKKAREIAMDGMPAAAPSRAAPTVPDIVTPEPTLRP